MQKNMAQKNSVPLRFEGRKWITLHTVHFLNYNKFVTCLKNCPSQLIQVMHFHYYEAVVVKQILYLPLTAPLACHSYRLSPSSFCHTTDCNVSSGSIVTLNLICAGLHRATYGSPVFNPTELICTP